MPRPATNPLLATLRKLAKGADSIYIHVHRDFSAPSYSDACIFTVKFIHKHNGQDVKSEVEVPGTVANGYTSKHEYYTYAGRPEVRYDDAYRPGKGFWSLMGCVDNVRDAFDLMPSHLQPRFIISLDGGTNQYQTKNRLHTDLLYFIGADNDGQRRRILLDTYCGEHNSSRFGSPTHDDDTRGRDSN